MRFSLSRSIAPLRCSRVLRLASAARRAGCHHGLPALELRPFAGVNGEASAGLASRGADPEAHLVGVGHVVVFFQLVDRDPLATLWVMPGQASSWSSR